MNGTVPEVGDTIYVDTRLHLSRGRDDVLGGRATVVAVSKLRADSANHFVQVAEHPGSYNWEGYLRGEQERLAEKFGEERARPDPDYRPMFNEW